MALARQSDAMVVIGGRTSSNTCKLRDVCAQFCPTYHIETPDELSAALFCPVSARSASLPGLPLRQA